MLLKCKKRLTLWTCGRRCVSGHGHPVAGLPPEPHRQMPELHGRLHGSVSRHQGLSVSVPAPVPDTAAGPLRLEYIYIDGRFISIIFQLLVCFHALFAIFKKERQNFIFIVRRRLASPSATGRWWTLTAPGITSPTCRRARRRTRSRSPR